ncbi:MAG: zinc-ribbon domain-containing protein [Clostridia bacterium]|nr:zinc-ribbon domain-containing protein [Clostridia bacterium]
MVIYNETYDNFPNCNYDIEAMDNTTEIENIISEIENSLEKLYYKIGKDYVLGVASNKEPSIDEDMAYTLKALKTVDDLKKRINYLKSIKKCSKCGAELAENAMFCSICGYLALLPGEEIPEGFITCKKCAKILTADSKFCTECGTAVSSEPVFEEYPEEPQNIDENEPSDEVEQPIVIPTQEKEEPGIVCAVCGYVLRADSVFCTECGSPVAPAENEVQEMPSQNAEEAAEPDFDAVDAADEYPLTEANEDTPFENVIEEEVVCETYICQNCNNPVTKDMAFCTSCGVALIFEDTDAEESNGEYYESYESNDQSFEVINGNVQEYTEKADSNNEDVCSVCGAQIKENMAFCTNCGTPVASTFDEPTLMAIHPSSVTTESETFCTSCGSALELGAIFCTNCGTPVAPSYNSETPKTCPNCGQTADKNSGSLFCTNCGSKL